MFFFQILYVWIFLGIWFLLFELGTPGLFYFLSFSIAAFITAIATFFITTIIYQVLFFLLATVFAFLLLHVVFLPLLQSDKKNYKSNVEALIGKQGYVVMSIGKYHSGQVKMNGEVWSARSEKNEVIEKNREVMVIAVKGVHLIVKKV